MNIFKVGMTFSTTCIFTGGSHAYKITERNGDIIKASARFEEADGTHRTEEEFTIHSDEKGEYIVAWEYKDKQGRVYACDLEEDTILCEFSVEDKGTFIVYGDYEIEEQTDMYGRNYKYPEFSNLKAKKVEDGKKVDYSPDGTTWSGRHYDVEDMITECIANTILGNKLFEVSYMEETLKEIIDSYLMPTEISVTVEGKDVPGRILHGCMLNIYTLELVTDEYMYYIHDDEFLMVATESREVVSDNYFASVGFDDSVEAVREGTEKLLWGELPQEE